MQPPAIAPSERSRAALARARSTQLRERAEVLRVDAAELAARMFEGLSHTPGQTHGESADGFFLRLARLDPAIAFARNTFRRWLERAGVADGEAFEIALACSEVVSNAVEHPVGAERQAFELCATWHAEELRIVVRDFGRWRGAHPSQGRGRGLDMIRRLVEDVKIVECDGGTCVTMTRRVSRSDEGRPGPARDRDPGPASATTARSMRSGS